MSEFLLEMRGVCKSFPGVKALDHAQLRLRPGTVHALMGENGAGKSTTIKAILDLIIVFIMTASMGKGCILSAIPVGIFQGLVTLLARLIEPFMTEAALSNLSFVGSVLLFCVGVNLVWGKKVKVANLLPAILFAVLWSFAPWA